MNNLNKQLLLSMLTMLIMAFLSGCQKSDTGTDSDTNYSVKYQITASTGLTTVKIRYKTIPVAGADAESKDANNTGGNTELPWTAILSSIGYHKAPYYVYVSSRDILTGWIYVKVYQDNVLVKKDSAYGNGQVIELSGNLPK